MGQSIILLLALTVMSSKCIQATCKDTSNSPKDCVTVSLHNAINWEGNGGVFDIYPGNSGRKMQAYCDLTTDGGGWTIFQRRMNGSVDFYRHWADYVIGFGNPAGEFWMGLEKLHSLTTIQDVELRIDMEDWEGNTAYAYYTTFSIGDSSTNYQLNVGGYSGTAGDSLMNSIQHGGIVNHQSMPFSTFDKDNDKTTLETCAETYHGAWWYNGCWYANLNGVYYVGGQYVSSPANGIVWMGWQNDMFYSLKFVEMKFRPKL